ncbi:MAG TPA: replication-associated recombination protein A [Candidatus Kapabacteria bacterium]|nr:replication-associated recombination protein A [Candidatus Kapabacteria bacterium]
MKDIVSPLADRMRPTSFDTFVGQEDIVGKGKLLRTLIEKDELSSLIFWGPPGVGKTTLAHIIAEQTGSHFVVLSAVESGKKELRDVVQEAKERLEKEQRRTILFIDEIHRWNKAQQDALLPFVEKGTITLIGATTENPSFEIIGALLSRSRVFILKSLETKDIVTVLRRALSDTSHGLGALPIEVADETLEVLAELAGGDARTALNALELAAKAKRQKGKRIVLTVADIKEALQRTHLVFDKKGEEFYNAISALHKSMRGSDANAALYWLARMLEGGADPLYVARRILRFASEDIGMANSEALIQASAAYDACHKIGMPECSVHLAQAVVYCAKSQKSNLLYRAYGQAAADAKRTSHLGVPIHLRNAPTKFMKEIGYGKEYKYNPAYEGDVDQEYFPPELKGRNYLAPTQKKRDEDIS